MKPELLKKFSEARTLFPHTRRIVYLNSASTGPMPVTVKQAIEENLQLRVAAEKDDWHDAMVVADGLRRDYGKLIGAKASQIGIGLNTSFGLNVAAFGLPLKRGDEVIISEREFPAIVYTWRAAAEARGLKLKAIPAPESRFDIDAFRKAIGRRTRVLSVSWVQFYNGFRNDIKTLAEICQKHDIWFIVDGIQGMGNQPINVRKLGIDIFTSGCQKWMLSPQGCGFFFVSDRINDQLSLPFFSWLGVDWKMKFSDLFYSDRPFFDTAQRLELGYGVTTNLYGMAAAVEIFKYLGIGNIQKHNQDLQDSLVHYLQEHPFYQITSSLVPKHRSSILTFTCKGYRDLHQECIKNRIMLVPREGSIRVAIHLYNNEADIDRLIDVLDKFRKSA